MAGNEQIKQRNLAYIMLKLYKDNWKAKFPMDMGIPIDVCVSIMAKYGREVAQMIDKEREELLSLGRSDVPTAKKIIDNAMKKIERTISTCEDPSKIARTIQILEELDKSSDNLRKEKKKTILDKYKNKNNNEDD
jgi:hypothetical protein